MRRSAEDTKALILDAARERFAREGYDRATVRAIAAEAGIDPSMIIRYFGSKQRLFSTAVDFDLHLPDLSGLPREEVGAALVGHFADRWSGDDPLVTLLRTASTDDQTADRMRRIFAKQVSPMVAAVCDDPAEVPRRTGLVASQILGLALCRFVLRLPPVAGLTRAELVAWYGPTLQRYLTAPRP